MLAAAMAKSYKFPPLKWLMSFEAAARHMSFTAAAAELGLSQAAVSYQIACLESMIKSPLFERKPRSLRLTSVGQAYLRPIRHAFDEMFASTAGLFGNQGERIVTARVAISFMVRCLAPAMPEFYALHPDIKINFWSSIWANTQETDGADIDIRFGTGNWSGFEAMRICGDSAVLVSCPQHAHMVQSRDDIARIPGNMMIIVAGYDETWRSALVRTSDHHKLGHAIRVDTTIAAAELVAAGVGFAFLSRLFSNSDVKSGRLVTPGNIELAMESAHFLLQPQSGTRSASDVLIFKQWVLGRDWFS